MTSDTVRGTRRRWRKLLGIPLALIALLAVFALLLAVVPYRAPAYQRGSRTAEVAEREFAALIARDRADPTLWPECAAADIPAVGRQRGTVLLFHGYTSCPHQYSALAAQLAQRGYRVLIPRIPGHGIARTDRELQPFDLDELTTFASSVTDLAVAIDPTVVVGGLSGGGTLALWVNAHRTDLSRVVAVAPFLSPHLVPTELSHPAGNLVRAVPNLYIWWNSELKDADQVPRYSYAKFSTHSIAALMTLATATARHSGTSAAHTVYVLNAADTAIDEQVIRNLIAEQRDAGEDVAAYEFPAALEAPHEYIDDQNPDNKIADTFPTLIDVLTTGQTARLAES